MKTFSITKLEIARNNPKDFAKSLKLVTNKDSFFGRSQFIRWQDAVNEFHKTNNLSLALNYLERSFSHYAITSKNRKSYERYLVSLDEYVKAVKKSGNIYLKKESIKIPLNSKSMITGRVPVTFMNNHEGFSLYFFSKISSGWQNELRFPIIQNYFAEEVYGTDLDKVFVGIFSIENNKFFEYSYSMEEIEDAKKELSRISRAIFIVL
jgi:hypothetical protein